MATLEIADLPQIWQRPAHGEIIGALRSLELSPPVWSFKQRREMSVQAQESLASQRKGEAMRYLSTIVGSTLDWIEDDDSKEEIWDMAGKRMTERCGRAAMGDITRSWPFESEDGVSYEPFELLVKEPGMTEAALGLKTWGSSYVLAQNLPRLGATSLFRLFDESLGQPAPAVLELGSGTGLLGLAAAALWKTHVFQSDLPGIVPNLKTNAEQNLELIKSRGRDLSVGHLTWGGDGKEEIDQEMFGQPFQFQIVLAADVLYFDDHPALLADAICQNLALGSVSRAVVMAPRRDEAAGRLRDMFKQAMLDLETPLFLEHEEELVGQDDWGDDEDGGNIRCWLGVFSRGGSPRLV